MERVLHLALLGSGGILSRTLALIALLAIPLSPLGAQFVAGPQGQKAVAEDKDFLRLTPAQFLRKIEIRDESLDTVARISTERGWREGIAFFGGPTQDNFLRAFIDKQNGRTIFQLYQWITYPGVKRVYETVNYDTPGGPQVRKVTGIYRTPNYCRSNVRCSYTEDLGVEIPEGLLRRMAAYYASGTPRAWHFKFGSKAGAETEDEMNLAEIAGLLAAVDQYRTAHRLEAAPLAPRQAKRGQATSLQRSR
jgi:hypothetical protein